MKNLLNYLFLLFLTYIVQTKILYLPEYKQERKLIATNKINVKAKNWNYFQKHFTYTRKLENEKSSQVNSNITHNQVVNEKKSQTETYTPKKYETYTIDTKDNDLNSLINSAMNSTHNKPLIIINHQETRDMPMPQNTHHNQQDTQLNSETAQIQKNTVNSMDSVSIDDLPTLEKLLDNVKKIYTNFYDKLPEDSNKDSIDNINHDDINQYIIKLKTFTRDVIMNSQNLMNDINYFQRKVHLIKSGENEMISFYNQEEKYARLKTQSVLMEESNIKDNWLRLNSFSLDFNQQVKDIYKHSYELYKFNLFFANQIKQINYSSTNNGSQLAENKFDQVLMFSIRLIEIKVDIEKAIINLKKSLENIKMISFEVDRVLMDLNNTINDKETEIRKEEVETAQTLKQVQLPNKSYYEKIILTGYLMFLIV